MDGLAGRAVAGAAGVGRRRCWPPGRDHHDPGACRGAGKDEARAGPWGGGAGWRHALGRRVLHGEVTVQTQEGVKTMVMARGEVTALSKDAITVKSSDGVETSFGIDGDTRYGFRNETAPTAELKVGEDAFVTGEKSGDRAVAKRVVSGDLARRGAGKGATP